MVKRRSQSINLIPLELRPPPMLSWDLALVCLFAVSILTGSLLTYGQHVQKRKLQTEVNSVQSESVALDRKIIDLQAALTASSSVKEQQQLVSKIIHEKLNWADIFKELGLVMPLKTWLTKFSVLNNSGTLSIAMDGKTDSQANMASLFGALEKSVHFNRLLLVSSKINEDTQPPLFQFHFASKELAKKREAAGGAQ